MNCMQVFKIIALAYTKNTGKTVMNHRQKQMFRKQQEAFRRLVDEQQP